ELPDSYLVASARPRPAPPTATPRPPTVTPRSPEVERVVEDGGELGAADGARRSTEEAWLLERAVDERGDVALGVAKCCEAVGDGDVAHERAQRVRQRFARFAVREARGRHAHQLGRAQVPLG